MISLDRPPVPDRPLPDRDALRYATLLAARRVARRPRRRRLPLILTLVAAALVATVLVGVLRSVGPTPQVAGPVPSSTPVPTVKVTPLPDDAVVTDRGPASAAQVEAATKRCLSGSDEQKVIRTLLARRVFDGTVESTAVVVQLADGTITCLSEGKHVMQGEVDPIRATTDRPAVVVGGVGLYWTVVTDSDLTDRTAAVLSVSPEVRTVDVVASGPEWPGRRFRAQAYDGWVYVPVVGQRSVPKSKDVRSASLHLVITAYDASGRPLPVQR